ncbi:MAG: 3-hydroxyacyl-ACP dehydratase FabZ family protein [Gemmatimonadaceae bacterium]
MTPASDHPTAGAPPLPEVLGLLAHRYPFLLLDRITALEPGRRATGLKRVTGTEWFCRQAIVAGGGGPAMPSVLVVEALAQLSGAVLLGLLDGSASAVGYFMGLTRVRYRGEARPGDELRLEVTLRQFRRGICRTYGEAWVGGRRIVRAELTTVVRGTRAADAG